VVVKKCQAKMQVVAEGVLTRSVKMPERSFETAVLSNVEGAAEERGLLRTNGIGIDFKGLIRSS
jgi:hypothetical protein